MELSLRPSASRRGKTHGRLAWLLRAYHEGGQVIIEISDDGSGLDSDKLRKKAVEKGLVAAELATRMSDREAANLIFLPGLSTADKVTNVSGRGVGMDVVKTHIEKIGGTVDVQVESGRWHYGPHENPPHPGHYSGLDRHFRRRPLCDSAN